MRARRAEAVLEGARPTPEVVARARAALLDEIAPIADRGFGFVTKFKVPGGFEIELYQPKYRKG